MTVAALSEADKAPLSQEWLDLEKKMGMRILLDLHAAPINEIRRMGAQVADARLPLFPPPPTNLQIKDEQIRGPDGPINIRIYTPSSGGPFPCIAFYHGGGHVLGDEKREDLGCRHVCGNTNCVVVSVGYRHAPENPYPADVEDSFAGLKWIFENQKHLNGSGKVMTAGNSAGGSLALVMTRRLRDSGLPYKLCAEILRIPMVCHPKAHPAEISGPDSSYNSFTDEHTAILSKRGADEFWNTYVTPSRANELDCSPLLATEFKDFPPTYISICGCDPLRDEGYLLAKKMNTAGVKVKFQVYQGLPHGFWQLPQIKSTSKAMQDFNDAVKWGLSA